MAEEIAKLNSPIDAMYLMHKAFQAQSTRTEQLAAGLRRAATCRRELAPRPGGRGRQRVTRLKGSAPLPACTPSSGPISNPALQCDFLHSRIHRGFEGAAGR